MLLHLPEAPYIYPTSIIPSFHDNTFYENVTSRLS
ncbi:hypothetical protein SAMN05421823_11627 [Catalinimonas alkaloidigena]|uniref:Uncharacterized protein n=1 Tax=Catalinimonas alkaloidigena TaxID=1075417 RepID=A0A1G9UD16_9BACT|nr:hypothetical protein SAMN05421823_11627 [Catalinimonas alkaloidigena]